MRLRHVPQAAAIVAASPFVIAVEKEPRGCALSERQKQGLSLEIGMGKGDFIIGMAQRYPEREFIGVELYESVLYKACEKMAALSKEGAAPKNLHFLNVDARALPEILPAASVEALYLNFSDPWPKERHAKRRLTSPQFLAVYAQILKDRARLQMKTDQAALFDYSLETLGAAPQWEVLDIVQDVHRDEALMRENIMTEYERKFSALGSRILQLTAVFHQGEGKEALDG